MQLTIERPKTVNLEELFELRVDIAPSLGMAPQLRAQNILIGTPEVMWEVDRVCCEINSVMIWWPQEVTHHDFQNGVRLLMRGDKIIVSIDWTNIWRK